MMISFCPMGGWHSGFISQTGTLYVKKDYFGVSFAGEMQMVETIEVCNADLGKWRLVIAAAENLPLYNQSECVGTVEIR